MPRTEAQKIRRKINENTPENKKKRLISEWKKLGLIAINYELIYDRYYYSSHCENCKCEYVIKTNKKCMDHDHKTGLFRNILCNSCNANLNSANTTGIPNISPHKSGGYHYSRWINKKRYTKYSKDLEWLKNYKKEFELKHIYIH